MDRMIDAPTAEDAVKVLAEIGYCTNEREADLLKTVAYRQAIAEGLAEGIMAYRDRSLGRLTAEGRTSRRTTIQ